VEFLHIVALALLQGLTEFLPISSSAHLILLPRLLGWEDQGLGFDVAVHVGTLIAVVGYFRHELLTLTRDWLCSLVRRHRCGDSNLAWAVLFGTIPVGLAGLLLGDLVEGSLRSPSVIAWATIGFGLLLWWADRKGGGRRDEHGLGWRDVLTIGCAQALALIPGTSRSGITMTAGLMLGLSREAAARFSFLLSIPVILLAGGLKGLEWLEASNPKEAWSDLLVGTLLSALAAWLCIHFFLKWIGRSGMWPFVLYRLTLGAWLLMLF
jgi:undecaprenyl-diphosphatase